MFNYQAIKTHFKEMSGYIMFSTILFVAGVIIGGTNPALQSFLNGQLSGLKQLSEGIQSSANPTLTMMIIIFFNNAIKSVLVMYFGALLGLIPVVFLIVNGMLIGYMMQLSSSNIGFAQTAELFVKGILPHGIIEIPAIIIACAYGLKFGIVLLQLVGKAVFVRNQTEGAVKNVEYFLIRSVPVAVLLVVALLVAAIIESTFTGWLLGK